MYCNVTHFCSIAEGTRYSVRYAGGILREAVKVNSAYGRMDSGEYMTMTAEDEVAVIPTRKVVPIGLM